MYTKAIIYFRITLEFEKKCLITLWVVFPTYQFYYNTGRVRLLHYGPFLLHYGQLLHYGSFFITLWVVITLWVDFITLWACCVYYIMGRFYYIMGRYYIMGQLLHYGTVITLWVVVATHNVITIP